jgi:hypothetical protein
MQAVLSEPQPAQVALPPAGNLLELRRSWRLLLFWTIAVAVMWALAFHAADKPPFLNNRHASPRTAVEAMSTWDGAVYAAIAQNGYSINGKDRRFFNFFPLFPAVTRVLGGRSHTMLAGVLLSQLLTLASILMMSWIAHGSEPAPVLREPGLWMLVSPFGFFLLCNYTEALFLFLTLLHYAAFKSNRARLCFISGFLAGLTRPTAIVLPALLGFEALRRWRRNEEWKTAVLCAIAPALGIALYVIGFVGWMTGDVGAYTKISDHYFTRTLVIPFTDYLQAVVFTLQKGMLADIPVLLRAVSTTIVLAVLIARRKTIEPALLAYSVATLLFVHAIYPQTGTGRFELVLFPVFFAIAASTVPRFRVAWIIVAASACISAKAFLHFAQWDWIA